MNAECPVPALSQHLEIAPSLRRLDYSKCVLLLRYWQVHSIVAGHLKKHS